jgi:sRNA-binding protein
VRTIPNVTATSPRVTSSAQALRKSSREFCTCWKRHEVARGGGGRKELNHPVAGKLVFEHAVFGPQEAPDQRLVLYTPMPEADTKAKLASLFEI